MIYGYARCSTTETKQDVERQIKELRAMGAAEIYHEYESGTKINRAELAKLFGHIGPGDTIVTTEVSRITRSVRQLCDIIETAKEKRLKFIFGSFVVDCTGELDVMTEGMLKMMAVFAEIERNLIIERVKSGLRNAKAKGIRLGRPPISADRIPPKVIEYQAIFKDGLISKQTFAKLCGVSRPTLNKYIAILADR
jgi:DNA invertase Pin-like site-specific DNA recombinase